MKFFSIQLFRITAAVFGLAGIGLIVLAFLHSPLVSQVIIGLIGVVSLSLAPLFLALARRETREQERYAQIMAKLEEIEEQFKQQEEKPGKSGVAIADIISSGMKFYSEYISKDKDKEEP